MTEGREVKHWHVGAVLSPIEVRVCKPLLRNLIATFKPQMTGVVRPLEPREFKEVVLNAQDAAEADAGDFNDRVAEIKARWWRMKGRHCKNEKSYENATGVRQP